MKKTGEAGGVMQRHTPHCAGAREGMGARGVPSVRASAELRAVLGRPHALEAPAKEGVVLPRAPGSSSCPRFVRRRLANRLPELCEALIERALAGDLAAAKLLWQMAELDKPAARGSGKTKTDPGFARRALAEFRAR